MRKIVVIPARLGSTRLPGKVLLDLGGKSVLEHVYTRACQAKGIDGVYIATDSTTVHDHCQQFTDHVIMTSADHESGTDRIAEAVNALACDVVVNVQGDEPFIEPELITQVADAVSAERAPMSSAMHRIDTTEELANPNVVKVVVNRDKQAIYFSRSIIPHHRDEWQTLTEHHVTIPEAITFYRHIGIYGFSREFLLTFSAMAPSYLERLEKLEQLRVIENGYAIQMVTTHYEAVGIDTQEDYEKALAKIGRENEQ